MLHYLILAHTNPKQLALLVASLHTAQSKIHVHIDKNVAIEPFLFLADRCIFIQDRVRIRAGGMSMIQATLRGMQHIHAAMWAGDHLVLMSGQDFPIKSATHIHKAIEKVWYKSIIECIKQPDRKWNTVNRVTHYWFYDRAIPFGIDAWLKKYIGKIWNISSFKSSLLGGILNRTLTHVLPRRKFLLDHYELYSGSQWAVFSAEAIDYIMHFCSTDKWQSYVHFMKYAGVPDEFFFQTLLMNSPLKDKILNDLARYIDRSFQWEWPKILRLEDYPQLLGSSKLFARKFNIDRDAAIVEKIYKYIQS